MEKTCEDCKWWLANYALLPKDIPRDNDVGACMNQDLLAQPVTHLKLEPPDAFLATGKAFGCNQWEEREVGNSPDD